MGTAKPDVRRMLRGIALGHPFIEIAGQVLDAIGAPPQLAIADRQTHTPAPQRNIDFHTALDSASHARMRYGNVARPRAKTWLAR